MKKCKYCGTRINFVKSKGKYIPVEENPVAIITDRGNQVTGHPVHNCRKPKGEALLEKAVETGVDLALKHIQRSVKR